MEPEKNTQCTNCAELWKLLNEANEEKAQLSRQKASAKTWLNIFIVLAIINGIVTMLKLVSR